MVVYIGHSWISVASGGRVRWLMEDGCSWCSKLVVLLAVDVSQRWSFVARAWWLVVVGGQSWSLLVVDGSLCWSLVASGG